MADARGPRLLMDLNNAFRRDPFIDEYDVLLVLEPKHNKSPFILQNHKLGVEAWAAKILMKYAANRLIGWRSHDPSERFVDPQDICNLSRAVLLFNPDNYTAWNIRKELVDSGALTVSDDLALGSLILTKHPKSPETFIHRRWLFQQLLDNCLSSSSGSNASCSAPAASMEEHLVNVDAIDVDVGAHPDVAGRPNGAFSLDSSRLLRTKTTQELDVCTQAAQRYPCNYHAWSHRMWVIKHCLNSSLQILLSELEATRKWTSSHISDHSGFHFRQFLLSELKRNESRLRPLYQGDFLSLLQAEIDFVADLIHCYPGHEALWYHRRYVFHELFIQAQGSQAERMVSREEETMQETCDHHKLIQDEISKVDFKRKSAVDQLDTSLAKNYIRWLKSIV